MDRLRKLAATEPKAIQRDRFRVVILAMEGHEEPRIRAVVARGRTFVQDWCYAYRDGGIDALQAKKQPGRPPKLRDAQVEQFRERVAANAREEDNVCTLRGADFQRILKKEFNAELSLSGVYGLLHRLGYSCLKPRPQHRNSDPEAQERWKDRAPFLSGTSASSTPTNASSSSSRTSAGSVSKGG